MPDVFDFLASSGKKSGSAYGACACKCGKPTNAGSIFVPYRRYVPYFEGEGGAWVATSSCQAKVIGLLRGYTPDWRKKKK